MRSLKQARNAIFGYNHSNSYVTLVLTIAKRFDSGVVTVVPNSAPPTPAQRRADAIRVSPGQARRAGRSPPPEAELTTPNHKPTHRPKPTHKPKPKPTPKPKPKPTHKPKPHAQPEAAQAEAQAHKPKPKPKPKPTPEPVVSTLDGTFTVSVDGVWSIGSTVLDLGTANLALPQADYDGDGVVEPVTDELAGTGRRRRNGRTRSRRTGRGHQRPALRPDIDRAVEPATTETASAGTWADERLPRHPDATDRAELSQQ